MAELRASHFDLFDFSNIQAVIANLEAHHNTLCFKSKNDKNLNKKPPNSVVFCFRVVSGFTPFYLLRCMRAPSFVLLDQRG
jgi:hypothetical protein